MLQRSIAFDVPTPRADIAVPGSATQDALALASRLGAAGLEPRLIRSGCGITAGGVDFQVLLRKCARSHQSIEHLLCRVAAVIDDGVPVTLSLRELGTGSSGVDVLEEFCLRVREYLGPEQASKIGLCVQSHQIPLQAFQLVSRVVLGQGPRYAILDSLQMQQHHDTKVQDETDRNWSLLWRQRLSDAALMPAYGAGVRAGCQLLGDEAAQAVLPSCGIRVPAGSAWLPIGLNLSRYADDGQIDWPRIKRQLAHCIDLGDQLLDLLCWPTACQRSDAWFNRRLGIVLTGLGDLVRRRGADPAELESLQWLNEIVLKIRNTLWGRSRALATRAGLLPALAGSDPTCGLGDLHRQTWQRRWRHAVASSAVRHRNLLVMSPYSVLPDDGLSDTRYTDLLPVLFHADAYAFDSPPSFDGWTVTDFRNFHQRAWAVMQRRDRCSLIAAAV